MHINDFDYQLPEGLIAIHPAEPRDSCRLLVLDRTTGRVSHHIFSDISSIVDNRTVLVLNETKVFPARLFGKKRTGGKVELLLLKQTGLSQYLAIGKGKLRLGQIINFDHQLSCTVTHKEEDGSLRLDFNLSGPTLLDKIDLLGKTPLPPYIKSNIPEELLRHQYQTVYAKEKGSAAAPTAGLHFTPSLLSTLQDKGVEIEKVVLHIGLGTFKPVTAQQIIDKQLHSEEYFVSPEVVDRLNHAKANGKRIIAVGTTTCRVLESISDIDGKLHSGGGETNIFIQPGYKFKFIDGLITNFHLPKTSLLMLVSALTTFPNSPTSFTNFNDSPIGQAYLEAIRKEYKFFSFGDAMLIL